MDLLDRLLHHDYWTTRRLLELSTTLGDEELDREFDLGCGTLRRTFSHVVYNVEGWSRIMRDEEWGGERDDTGSVDSMIVRLDDEYPRFALFARQVRDRDGWDEMWFDRWDEPGREKSFGGAIAHLITHSMHHRAQILFMLRRLGVEDVPEGDALSSERTLGG